ncbi:MAG: HAMP domain-containing protein, partial [Desulfuromonadales bacterium]|nr:HAMP domain-containing protein [Desulfuromonadales bacterium]
MRFSLSNLSLKARISLAVGAVFIAFAGGTIFFAFRYFENAFRDSVDHDLALMSFSLANSIDDHLAVAQSALEAAAAALPPEAATDPLLAKTFLSQRVSLQTLFPYDLFLISPQGRLLAAYPNHLEEPREFADSPFFVTASASKAPFITPWESEAHQGGEIVIAVPVLDMDGEVSAVLAGSFATTIGAVETEEMLLDRIGPGGHVAVVSRDGVLLRHHGTDPCEPVVPDAAWPLFAQAVAEGESTGISRDCCGSEALILLRRLARIDGVLAISYPIALAYAPLTQAKDYFLGAILLGTLLLLALARVLTRRAMEPLAVMTRHVQALPQLPPDQRLLHLRRHDEIGILADAFDTMMTTLESRKAALRASERRLQQRADELAAMNRELEAFSYSLSHDLKSPLTCICMSAEALQGIAGKFGNDDVDFFVATIQGESLRMEGLLDAMLLLSRLSRSELRLEPVNLSILAGEILVRLQYEHPQRQVEWAVASNMKATGDPRLLMSVLQNLLGNAWKYSGKQAAAQIEFGALEQPERIFYVRDNGIGFDMGDAERLFQPFNRLHISQGYTGFGVGLTIVQRIIQRHGGRVWAQAAPG